MARELADVLHYFFDDAPPRGQAGRAPLLAVPLEGGDALRASFVWNLAVELARAGAQPVVLVPGGAPFAADLVPDPPLGGLLAPELARVPASGVAALAGAARGLRGRPRAGPVIALLPPSWIGDAPGAAEILGWTLLFARPEAEALDATAALARRVAAAAPEACLGVTLHGVGSVAEARAAFGDLARRCAPAPGAGLWSYGLLLDDLDVYRAFAEGRALGLARPQSPAARALADVARLVLEDARAGAVQP